MAHSAQFTAAEAAFVLREPVKAVKKALDSGPVRPVLLRRAGAAVRTIEWRDLFYLYAVRALRDELTPKARTEFYEALLQTPIERHDEVQFGRFRIAVGDLVEEVERRTDDLAALADKVEFRADGEPLLKGTSIEVYRIAALLDGGAAIEQVLEDYPSLSRQEVETAKAYAEAHPKAGRPYPRTSVKLALRGAGLEALDDA
ncbi:DUF433 domain-containing protein [Xanthobacter autotrophicus]|uniref:DUF433 domain-containing protein n=1 Tax=Xanthobacter autotrophicus TaxID=280 RepID=UPI00372AB24D